VSSGRPPRRAPLTVAVRDDVARRARAFLAERHQLDTAAAERLAAVPVVWRFRRKRKKAHFTSGPGDGVPGPHVVVDVPPGATASWNTYRRVGARLSTPPGGLVLPLRTYLELVLVHEYTHALQHGLGVSAKRAYSEVETTRNEIEYARRHAPEVYARLVPVPPGSTRRKRTARTPAAAPTGRTSAVAPVLRLLADLARRLRRAW